jgi:hypothetical protein
VGIVFLTKHPEPDPEPEPDKSAVDDDMIDRVEAFVGLGCPELHALALAWNGVSPSEVRERWIKRGATWDQVGRYFLEYN